MQENKEKFLLFRIKVSKDKEAFETLCKGHESSLRRFLAIKFPTVNDAEDALSETLFRTWNYLTSGVEVESVSGLMYTIARGVIYEFYRKRPPQTTDITSIQETIPFTKDATEAGAEIALVKQALDKISESYRQVIILKHFEGMSVKQVAKEINKSENNARVTLYRAMKALREQLDI
ncbi:RNA polymerase sigma factor [Patescibacteria group bacterium]